MNAVGLSCRPETLVATAYREGDHRAPLARKLMEAHGFEYGALVPRTVAALIDAALSLAPWPTEAEPIWTMARAALVGHHPGAPALDPKAGMQTRLSLVECDDILRSATELVTEYGSVYLQRSYEPGQPEPVETMMLPPAHLLPLGLALIELHFAMARRPT